MIQIAPIDQPLPLPSGRTRLARDIVFNLIGHGLPLLAALFAIPLLIRGLSTDRFGVLTLVWVVIGYFSLFDLGLGRALTQVLASSASQARETRAPSFVWTALASMFALGLLGTLIVGLLSPWLVHSVFKIPGPLQAETLQAFYLLASAIPLVVVTAGLVGILSAFHRFAVLNAIRAPMGIYTFVAPLAVLSLSQSLVAVTAALLTGRLLACGAFFVACHGLMPPIRSGLTARFAEIRPLFSFGAWMTVSNVIGPLMVYLDRFVIGAMVSVAAVAYYATPYEMVTKLLIVPGGILGVLFPAFAASYQSDHDRMVRLFVRGTKYVALILFPMVLVIAAFAREGLRWWLGDEFAQYSTAVLQWLVIGVFINSLSQVFAALVQGTGRPDLTARLHLLELPIYLLVLWWAIHAHGIVGAAVAWTGRVALDGVLLYWLSRRSLRDSAVLLRRMTAGLLFALGGLATPLLVAGTMPRGGTVLVILIVFVPVAWLMVFAEDERASFRALMGGLPLRKSATPLGIDEPWPDVEAVERCPYCFARERTLAHRDVQDWSFYCVPGKWSYWKCTPCESLYLSPRPTPTSLARAYGSYYTHRVAGRESFVPWLKERIANECWSHRLRADLRPRLHLPRTLGWMVRPLESRLVEPFEIAELLRLPRGRLMDVGCGHGYMVGIAKQLGWQAIGLEIDPPALHAARARGVDVLEGSYTRLAEFKQQLDCVICSHVLEHLYDPKDALVKIAEALKPCGTLLLSSPNATSLVRDHFGNNWRGLEAPRHLSIPSMRQLEANLRDVGFSVRQRQLARLWTAAESSRIQRRGTRLTAHDKAVATKLTAETTLSSDRRYDFVEFTCTKTGRGL